MSQPGQTLELGQLAHLRKRGDRPPPASPGSDKSNRFTQRGQRPYELTGLRVPLRQRGVERVAVRLDFECLFRKGDRVEFSGTGELG
jgi:hypothetical protein